MKTLLCFIISIAFSISLYSQTNDTSFSAKLSTGLKENKISLKCRTVKINYIENGETSQQVAFIYDLTIDDKSITDTLIWVEDCCTIEIIDINKTDNSKEILIAGPGMEDESCFRVYKNSDGPKLLCKADYCGSFEPDGKGTVSAGRWMGFCNIYDKFILSDNGEKLDKKFFDYYPVDMEYYFVNSSTGEYESQKFAKVASSFELFSERNINSKVAAITKPGDKIIITGLDVKTIKTMEKVENDEPYEVSWIWIQIKTEDGILGWILMKEWDQEYWSKKIEGVMFAA